MNTKKRNERRLLDLFAGSCQEFPSGKIVEWESPDFLVQFGSRIFGVEITKLYRPPVEGRAPHQAGESIRQRIAEMVEEQLGGLEPKGISVTIIFSKGYEFRKLIARKLAAAICGVVEAHIPDFGGEKRIGYEPTRDFLPSGVSELIIRREAGYDENDCTAPDGGFVPELSTEIVASRIKKKEKLLGAYRKVSDEQWLVVVMDSIEIATWYTVSSAVTDHQYAFDFDRVFLMWEMDGRVIELNCV